MQITPVLIRMISKERIYLCGPWRCPGSHSTETLSAGSAVKIMTGAPVPNGVDAVVMKEFCETKNGHVLVKKATQAGENIRKKGEEIKTGQTVLQAGTPVTPSVIGLLATLGLADVSVFKKPRIGIIATGNELIAPGKTLENGQIYDSNSFALSAACQQLGLPQIAVAHASDDPENLSETLKQTLAQSDVLITLGGVSVGDYDYVKSSLEALGMETRFWKINIKPGKPVLFGKFQNKLVFGLPGNPVSALVTFHLLVRPALLKILGHTHTSPNTCQALLTQTLKQKPGRRTFVRGKVFTQNGQWFATPTQGQGSHMMLGLAEANCLIVFPEDKDTLLENKLAEVYFL